VSQFETNPDSDTVEGANVMPIWGEWSV